MRVRLANEDDTIAFAQRVWASLPAAPDGWTLLLQGELGSGKSTFARALIKSAGHTGAVPSPTYTLIEPYSLPTVTIYHIDLYRIADEDELGYLGWDELDHGLRMVEWPERAPGLLESADLSLTLAYDGDGRVAELAGLSRRGKALVEGMTEGQ